MSKQNKKLADASNTEISSSHHNKENYSISLSLKKAFKMKYVSSKWKIQRVFKKKNVISDSTLMDNES